MSEPSSMKAVRSRGRTGRDGRDRRMKPSMVRPSCVMVRGPCAPCSEAADQPLDPLVVGLKRVLAEDGLALGIVELEIDPVHPVVHALQVRLADELAAQARPRGLRGCVLGALDGLVV